MSCYSFQDLFDAAGVTLNKTFFYSLPQVAINNYVKQLCLIANWEYEDRLGTDDVIYTAFGPYLL